MTTGSENKFRGDRSPEERDKGEKETCGRKEIRVEGRSKAKDDRAGEVKRKEQGRREDGGRYEERRTTGKEEEKYVGDTEDA